MKDFNEDIQTISHLEYNRDRAELALEDKYEDFIKDIISNYHRKFLSDVLFSCSITTFDSGGDIDYQIPSGIGFDEHDDIVLSFEHKRFMYFKDLNSSDMKSIVNDLINYIKDDE